jgi:O-methyltransferase/methyltransferase family protein
VPTESLLHLSSGFHVARALYVAAKLGVADLLADGPKSGAELAAATGTNAASLERILRLLACTGVFSQDEARRFALTPESIALQSKVAESLRDVIVFQLGEEAYRAWGELMHGVRTGAPAFDRAFGAGVWEYRAAHPEYGALFDRAMSSVVGAHIDAVLDAYPFSAFRRVVDLGGGVGTFMIALLSACPDMHGVLFDLPHVAEAARQRLADAGLAHRCAVQSGDLFAGVPPGADAYVLSRVIHDWDDAEAGMILANCRRAMPQGSKLLVFERLLPGAAAKSEAARSLLISDLTMMVMNGGRERTEDQYRALLAASGLRLLRTIPTASEISVLEAQAQDG